MNSKINQTAAQTNEWNKSRKCMYTYNYGCKYNYDVCSVSVILDNGTISICLLNNNILNYYTKLNAIMFLFV